MKTPISWGSAIHGKRLTSVPSFKIWWAYFYFGYPDELNRFAENVYRPNSFYPLINFILLIQAALVYSTS
jgi:hypothetical protein